MTGGKDFGTAAIIGDGVIGAGWAARFALMGWDVRVFDPDPDGARNLNAVLANARRSLPGLSDVALPPEGRLIWCNGMAEAVAQADWIQDSVRERLELKREVYQTLQAAISKDAIIGSSSSRYKPSDLQAGSARPGQIVVTHSCDPVYLLPVVELIASTANPPAVVDRAAAILTGIGMYPLRVRTECDAPLADRLLKAVWREALGMIRDGHATTTEVDDAIRYGFGLRWAQMGLFETYRIAGGEAGMRHFVAQFGPALAWPWSKLTDVPEMDDALIDRIASQSDAQSGHHDIRALERIRDDNLVTILRGLKARDYGAGTLLNAQDRRLDALPRTLDDIADLGRPVRTLDRAVPLDWTDYNGHMNEARYLQAFGDATDRMMALVGCDMDYVASGASFFTAETHIRHVDEVRAGTRIHVATQVLLGEGKKMHLYHEMYDGDRLLATGEHMLIHVDLTTRRAQVPDDRVALPLARIAAAHAALPWPEGAGRSVGRK